MSTNRVRVEIEAAISRVERERDLLDARILAYRDVLGMMEEMEAEAEPPPTPERPFGTGRAPRRDVQGVIKQAVADYMEAKGLGPRLDDVVIGAGILLGADLTQSATKRALDGLIARGEMRLHDGRYAPSTRLSEVVADAAK